MTRRKLDRREFGRLLGAAGVGSTLDAAGATAAPQVENAPTAQPGAKADAYTFFTSDEARFVDAAVAHLIPADELGPGALEAGVTVFIDRQLSGAFGTGAKWYMQGPWGESVPEQGYQLPLSPRELYRLSIEKINAHCRARYGALFDGAGPEQQIEVLEGLDDGSLALEGAPLAEFFRLLLQNTVEGFFSDPIYGGNRDKVGWRLVGFPGVGAAYLRHFGSYNEPYEVEPVGIEDVVNRRARIDEHGHVVHEPLHRVADVGED